MRKKRKFYYKDITGQKFGRYTVLFRVKVSKYRSLWKCRCDCGKETLLCATKLTKYGVTGCIKCYSKFNKIKHGKSNERVYKIWKSMKARCYNKTDVAYKNYGGRGIKVCDRWLESFDNFYEDMGDKPIGKSLDRYPNNNGDYEQSNCRWATRKQQNRNTRLSKLNKDIVLKIKQEYKETDITRKQLSEKYKMCLSCIGYAIKCNNNEYES